MYVYIYYFFSEYTFIQGFWSNAIKYIQQLLSIKKKKTKGKKPRRAQTGENSMCVCTNDGYHLSVDVFVRRMVSVVSIGHCGLFLCLWYIYEDIITVSTKLQKIAIK